MVKRQNIFREIFSGANGILSAKRVVGGIGMFVALSSIIYLVVVDRSNEVVENLLTTVIILSASLLGLPAITGVFGKSQIHSMHSMQQMNNEECFENKNNFTPPDPCEHCPHNKKGTN